ncbi:hypothetical protein NXW13_00720 [Bacteroides thetaiotaomicron]|nr:hypothetical protein [Bacteroides thetaiotaomicron]
MNAGTVYSDLSGVFAALKTAGKIDNIRKNGIILSFLTADGWVEAANLGGNPDMILRMPKVGRISAPVRPAEIPIT